MQRRGNIWPIMASTVEQSSVRVRKSYFYVIRYIKTWKDMRNGLSLKSIIVNKFQHPHFYLFITLFWTIKSMENLMFPRELLREK